MKAVLYSLLMSSVVVLVGCAAPELNPLVVLDVGTTAVESVKTSSTSPATGKPVEIPKATVAIDPLLLKPCEAFTKMLITNPTPRDILKQRSSDVEIHVACMRRQSALSKIVREAFNINP